MRWIADAGATKTDWLCEDGEYFQTEGLNVEIEGWAHAQTKLLAAAQLFTSKEITELHYYGPALHLEETRQRLRRLMSQLWNLPEERIFVYHDLLGAARAAWGKASGIVGILGTGSNCAEWDGERIQRQAGGHGYLLGDEGSGADLGRAFLSALLHREVPTEVEAAFWQENPYPSAQTPIDLRALVYASSRPSAFLAALAPFLQAHQSHPWVAALIRSRFAAFIQRTWGRWVSSLPVRYVGGIARAFEPLLQEMTLRYGGRWGGVVHSVARALLSYHLTYG